MTQKLVVHHTSTVAWAGSARVLQRCGDHPCVGNCDASRSKHGDLAGKSGDAVAPSVVDAVLAGPGIPLANPLRREAKQRLGYDFSRVRVHADAQAARSADAVRASAYTVGSHVVFASGRYSPETNQGQLLLWHELTHVLQQRDAEGSNSGAPVRIAAFDEAERQADAVSRAGSTPAQPVAAVAVRQVARSLQRGSSDPSCTGMAVPCATGDECTAPDTGREGSRDTSTSWTIELNVDTEADNWESALRHQSVGHTYLRFMESNGREYTYGFYPKRNVDEVHTAVDGCVHHPDRTHESCIDEQLRYRLNKAQYDAALAAAAGLCRSGHVYGIARTSTGWTPSYTCTTFARDVLTAAQQSMPGSTSKPTEVYFTTIPSFDNPNTLKENIQAERAAHPERAGVFYNDPCMTACERSFDECTQHGPGGGVCIAQRSACITHCPSGQRSDRMPHPG
jgi:Domain of unknown function (DUF4157)